MKFQHNSLFTKALGAATLIAVPWVGGCAQEDTVGSDVQRSTEITPGFYEVDRDASYQDIAVAGSRAYLVNGSPGVNQIEVVDLTTREVVDRYDALDDFPPVPASEQPDDRRSDLELSGVQVLEDGQVVVFGRRDDAFPKDIVGDFLGQGGRWQFSFVVQGLSHDGTSAEWSVALDLRGAVKPSRSIVQRESMHAFVSDDTIAITFSHLDEPDRVFTIPRPAGHEMVQLEAWDGVDLPVMEGTELPHVETPRSIAPGEDGAYLVAGSGGLFRVTETTLENIAPSLSFDAGHFLTEVRTSGELALIADSGAGLEVVSQQTGVSVASVDLPDDERGIDVSRRQVFFGTKTGFHVLNIDWEVPVDDAPADDAPPSGDDSGDDASCGWVWKTLGFGGWWAWECN